MRAARQLLLSLFDGAVGGRERQQPRGGAAPRGGGQQFAKQRTRDGEWGCVCGFPTNRSWRTACHACGRPRDVAQSGRTPGGKGGSRGASSGGGAQGQGGIGGFGGGGRWGGGPVGANGNRPLLLRRSGTSEERMDKDRAKGGCDRTPWRGKGINDAPTAGQGYAQSKGKGGSEKGAGNGKMGNHEGTANGKGDGGSTQGLEGGKWIKPTRVVDEEDFELVQPRKVWAGNGSGKAGGAGAQQQPTLGGGATDLRRRWSDEASDDDDGLDDDAADDDEGCDDRAEHGDMVDPKQLRAAYEEHARAVRDMEKRGGYGPALETLRRARDAAEGAWRGAKEPAPLPRRLAWAEAKLRKAETALTRARHALDEFDADMERQREVLCDRVRTADEWYRWRQGQLDDINAEAGERATGRNGGQETAARAEVRQRIRGHMLPEVQAILEELQDGTPVHERLTLLAASLADAEQKLVGGDSGDDVQRFNMGDDDMWDGDEDPGDDEYATDGLEATRRDTTARASNGDGRPAVWKPEGPGRWTRRGVDGDARSEGLGTGPRDPGTSAASGRASAEGPGDEGPAEGNRATAGGSSGGAGQTSAAGGDTGNGAEEDRAGERSAKHRRRATEEEARMESDAKRAMELQQQQSQAMAAQKESFEAGAGGFGSGVALSLAAQRYVQEVQKAQKRAHEKGIEPLSDGRDLIQLTPMELQSWIETNLGSDEL